MVFDIGELVDTDTTKLGAARDYVERIAGLDDKREGDLEFDPSIKAGIQLYITFQSYIRARCKLHFPFIKKAVGEASPEIGRICQNDSALGSIGHPQHFDVRRSKRCQSDFATGISKIVEACSSEDVADSLSQESAYPCETRLPLLPIKLGLRYPKLGGLKRASERDSPIKEMLVNDGFFVSTSYQIRLANLARIDNTIELNFTFTEGVFLTMRRSIEAPDGIILVSVEESDLLRVVSESLYCAISSRDLPAISQTKALLVDNADKISWMR